MSSRDFSPSCEDAIHTFLLNNYDQLIYECYSNNQNYFLVLSQLLTQSSGESEYFFAIMQKDRELCNIDNPPQFLYRVNDLLKQSIINKSFVDR